MKRNMLINLQGHLALTLGGWGAVLAIQALFKKKPYSHFPQTYYITKLYFAVYELFIENEFKVISFDVRLKNVVDLVSWNEPTPLSLLAYWLTLQKKW